MEKGQPVGRLAIEPRAEPRAPLVGRLERALRAAVARPRRRRDDETAPLQRGQPRVDVRALHAEVRARRAVETPPDRIAVPHAGGDETRMQGPQLLAAQTPSGHTPPTEDLRTRRRTPEVRGVNGPEDATVHRPAISLEHELADDEQQRTPRRGLIWLAVIVAVALVGVGVWAATGGVRPEARPTASPIHSDPPPDPGTAELPPGRPAITGSRDGATVTFRWTYANSLPTDSYFYRLSETGTPRPLAEPWLRLTDQPRDKQVCLWVRVKRASGRDASRTFEKGCVA